MIVRIHERRVAPETAADIGRAGVRPEIDRRFRRHVLITEEDAVPRAAQRYDAYILPLGKLFAKRGHLHKDLLRLVYRHIVIHLAIRFDKDLRFMRVRIVQHCLCGCSTCFQDQY